MNDNTKVLDQNPVSVSQADSVQSQNPVQPVSSVGGANKEVGRVVAPVSEFVKPSGAETPLNISSEVSEAKVEVKDDKPNLTNEHIGVGIKDSNPPPSVSSNITLPMSEEEIEKKLKTGQDDDSGKWLAGLIQKIIKAVGL